MFKKMFVSKWLDNQAKRIEENSESNVTNLMKSLKDSITGLNLFHSYLQLAHSVYQLLVATVVILASDKEEARLLKDFLKDLHMLLAKKIRQSANVVTALTKNKQFMHALEGVELCYENLMDSQKKFDEEEKLKSQKTFCLSKVEHIDTLVNSSKYYCEEFKSLINLNAIKVTQKIMALTEYSDEAADEINAFVMYMELALEKYPTKVGIKNIEGEWRVSCIYGDDGNPVEYKN